MRGIGGRERREEILEYPGKFQLLYRGKEEYCRGRKNRSKEGRRIGAGRKKLE